MSDETKVARVMHEYKHGTLHSGSKRGPRVQSRRQAIAIAMHQAGKSKRSKRSSRRSRRR